VTTSNHKLVLAVKFVPYDNSISNQGLTLKARDMRYARSFACFQVYPEVNRTVERRNGVENLSQNLGTRKNLTA
jgi:hypothetical protein